MKVFGRAAFVVLLVLGMVGLAGVVVTRYWLSAAPRQEQARNVADARPVDEQPLITAQRLAALAVTPEEQELAHTALHLADHEVDLTFTSALRTATLHPAPSSPAIQPLLARIESIEDQIKADEKEISRVKQLLDRAEETRKAALEEDLQLQQAILEVEQEDLDAAHQELIRAGGDSRSAIQRLIDQHKAWSLVQIAAPAATGTAQSPQQQPELRTVLVQWRAWRQLITKEEGLATARQEVNERAAKLAHEHQALIQPGNVQQGAAEKAQSSGNHQQTSAAAPGGKAAVAHGPAGVVSAFKEVAEERKNLAELDKRAEDLKQLSGIYGQWSALVTADKRAHLIRLLEGIGWIIVLLLLVVLADPLLRFVLARLAPQSRRQHMVRIVARFAIQAMGLGLILLVVSGPPSQLATILALAGAGLTVALKDFIVAFFGWFILMGGNGIRPGDWVEINGIGGEVLEVGLLHTVLLETGDWSDAGHPTGRKVTFVNSFAIEGHYFNFSTAGQWLWDEIEVPIPAGTDPYPIAEAVQKDVLEETKANMLLAEQEWQRVVPGHVARNFSAAPDISVRPTTLGVNVIVRYITRAHERYDLRTRLFYRIVEQLRNMQISHAPLAADAAKQVAEQLSLGPSRKSA
ncbi:MAG: mechanosensitive ion channel [Acidobacteriia bacterium]|nr:mechanosensitive ion channel [Terriglobia bacterium]